MTRLAAYGQVIWDASRADEGSISYIGANKVAAAVIAVADKEQAELRAEVEQLRRWKAEASEVTLGLQDVGKALGVGLGEQITGRSGVEAAKQLRAKVERVKALIEGKPFWGLLSVSEVQQALAGPPPEEVPS